MIPEFPKIHAPFKRDEGGKFIEEAALGIFDDLSRAPWYATEKLDGTNIRIGPEGQVLGRTDKAQLHEDLLAALAPIGREVGQWGADGHLAPGTVLYGEGVGPKIQGNPYGLDSHHFVLFDVWSPKLGWADREFVAMLAEDLGVYDPPAFPPDGETVYSDLQDWIDNFQMIALVSQERGIPLPESGLFPGRDSEGIVLRPRTELTFGGDPRRRVITKLKWRDFA